MKVLLFLPDISRTGGVERVVANLANLFNSWPQCEVTVLSCFNINTGTPYPIPSEVKLECLSARSYPRNPFKKVWWYLNLASPLSVYLKANRYDFVLAHGSYLCTTLSLTDAGGAVKVGCEHISHQSVNRLHKILRRLLYPRLDRLVVLTERDRLFFLRFLQRVSCIPNYVNDAGFSTPKKAGQQNLIITAGRLSHQKGFDLLLAAFSIVLHSNPNCRLVVYGEGEERTQLEETARKLRIDKHVAFPGETLRLGEKLSEADLFVMPSRFEGFPMILLEAMQCGLACISFSCSGPDEIIDHQVNGILVKQGDIHAFADAMISLMSDEKIRVELGSNALKKVKQYSPETIGTKWAEIFESFPNLCKEQLVHKTLS